MKTLKKILAAVLAVMMLLSVASVAVSASDFSFEYYFADDNFRTIYVTAFDGTIPEDGYVEIPDEIDGYRVVGIAEHTFDNLQDLKGIIISEKVTYIDEDAFYGCTNEIEVLVKAPEEDPEEDFDSEEWYEDHKQDYVIEGTTLVKYKGTDSVVTVPFNCETVAKGAFKGNRNITTLYVENGVKVIEESAFEDCIYLSEVNIASGVSDIEIGKNAFEGTAWLENFPSEFVSIGTNLIKYKGESSDIVVPNVFKSISSGAFYVGDDADKTIAFKIKVPVSIEKFGDDCFHLYNSVTKVYPQLVVYKDSAADKYAHEARLNHTYAALPGDVTSDGEITAGDSRHVLRIAAKLEESVDGTDMMYIADINGDNKVAADDARLILRIAAKIDKYSADELLTMPRTDYEVLVTAANALAFARAYGCAYSLNEYQYLSDVKMNTNTKTYLNMFSKELTSQKNAVTVTYNQDSQEAYDNLFDITLLEAGKIKSHSCALKDGMYYLTLVLEDETVPGYDVVADTFTQKVFPVETVAHFTSKAQNKAWYNDSIDYTMTYNDCTLNLVVNADTLRIDSMDLTMNYDFSITGKIMGIKIKNGDNPATATRTDVAKYTNFVYFSK